MIDAKQSEWQSMETAPTKGPIVHVELLGANGKVYVAHWAYGDGDGMMPPYGPAWFEEVKDTQGRTMYCREIAGPFVGWRAKP